MEVLWPFWRLGQEVDLVKAIDVSSHQTNAELQWLIDVVKPDHVIVRMYLPQEAPSQQVSKDHVAIVRDNGLSIGTYYWQYRDLSPTESPKYAIDLARSCGIDIPVMWIDLETYVNANGTISIPSMQQMLLALRQIEIEGEVAGTYTGKWVMDSYFPGSVALSPWPLWDGALRWPPKIELDVPYAGWNECAGRQFQSTPCDTSIFRRQYT